MELVHEQRKLIDELRPMLQRICDINRELDDEEFITDILCLIGQHRHTFEDQLVADHTDCVSLQVLSGKYEGIAGGMMEMAMNDKTFARAVKETNIVLKKNKR